MHCPFCGMVHTKNWEYVPMRSSKCSTTGITKAVVCIILYVGQRVSFLTIRVVLCHMSDVM